MKGICLAVSVVLLVAVVHSPAQVSGPTQRIAVFNFAAVVQRSVVGKQLKRAGDEKLAPATKKLEEAKAEAEKWQRAIASAKESTAAKEAAIKANERVAQLKRELSKTTERTMEEIGAKMYRELALVVKDYATSEGFDIVLTFAEPVQEEEVLSAQNIFRKVQGIDFYGGVMPFFVHSRSDITEQIIERLDRRQPIKSSGKN